VVTKLQNEFKGTGIEVGDIITAINGKKVENWIENNSKYFPASNVPTQLRDIADKLLRSNEESIQVSIESKTGIKNLDLETIPYKYFNTEEPASHKIINENIGYIYPGTLKKGEIDEIMPNFLDKKGLIIDLRCYPSDFLVFSLSKYLLNKRNKFVKFTFGSLENPGMFTYGKELSVGKRNKDYFKGKVIILINEQTQSQAEYTAMALKVSPNATVIGSTTAGADGNVSSIYLPGNIFTYISGIGVLYPDGSETQRVGIVPDLKTEPTIKGIKESRDEVLEKAIQLIDKK
jgi:C-terminal processing protease CtpA/Prc